MQINHSLNSLAQLEKQLEEKTNELAKLTGKNSGSNSKEKRDLQKDVSDNENKSIKHETPVKTNLLETQEIPIAYSIDGKNVSVQNSAHDTIIDITA